MKNATSRYGLVALVLALIFAVAPVACRVAPIYNVKDQTLSASSKVTQKQVEQAIIRACESLTWRAKVVSPGHIVATLHVRTHLAIADITYTKDKFSITYKESENLNAQGGQIHKSYNDWVMRLEQRIRVEVSSL